MKIRYDIISGGVMVTPQRGKDGVRQPTYTRKATANQSSARLKQYQSCIRHELQGETFAGRAAVQSAFANAAEKCSSSVSAKANFKSRKHFSGDFF